MNQEIKTRIICPIHECYHALCKRCKHRAYTFPRVKMDLSPEGLEGFGMITQCDQCGGELFTSKELYYNCQCTKCKEKRYFAEKTGEQTNAPLRCTCD